MAEGRCLGPSEVLSPRDRPNPLPHSCGAALGFVGDGAELSRGAGTLQGRRGSGGRAAGSCVPETGGVGGPCRTCTLAHACARLCVREACLHLTVGVGVVELWGVTHLAGARKRLQLGERLATLPATCRPWWSGDPGGCGPRAVRRPATWSQLTTHQLAWPAEGP